MVDKIKYIFIVLVLPAKSNCPACPCVKTALVLYI